MDFAPATAGGIAAINLDSARRRSWSRFWRAPERPGIAENIVEQELLTARFVGDLTAFDRLEVLVSHSPAPIRKRRKPRSSRRRSPARRIGSPRRRRALRRRWRAARLRRRRTFGSPCIRPPEKTCWKSLLPPQTRRQARALGGTGPAGPLLADLGEFDDAEGTYAGRCGNTGTSRHSPWRGFAFS